VAPTDAPNPHLVAKALTHPMRAKVLEILDRRIASPTQLSEELGIGVSHISYHVKVLRELECVELVAKRKRRGATEHRYRAVTRPYFSDTVWAQVPSTSRQGIADAVLRAIGDEACEALAAGTLGTRTDSHISRTSLDLDSTGWRDVTALLEETLDRVLAIQDESSARQAISKEATLNSKLAILHFESPPDPPAEPWAWLKI
jgi:DNA-binding transcriptional ArsR family regulator